MEPFLSILLYILTAVGVLMTFSFWLSDIRLNRRRFRWYYYLPAALLCAVWGTLFPVVFSAWLYAVSENTVLSVLWPVVYLLLILGSIFGGFGLFCQRDDFSKPFYFSLCLCTLVVLSGWLIRWIY